ncbi:MAG: gliding motility-associated C-terminal domain-containing protein [Treponema sp.]|jgi:outer membrane protein OmpA-like peptidoglycan-associated protein/flagellar hook assembly protein FlgD|nr:gliding motility-associated C-terminal domain-containing protein [Treponema sp.]
MMHKKFTAVFLAGFVFSAAYAVPPYPAVGADAAPDLYAPFMTGAGAFSTTSGGAPAAAVNPAAGGEAQRIVFDLGYLGLHGFGKEKGYGIGLDLGALFPTKYAVFGGSLRLLHSPFDASFPVKTTFGGNLNAAKELYPGLSLGAGLNFGFGSEWTLSGDLGFRYNMGELGPLDNFTWALVFRGLGKSWTPSWFTPMGGVSFDIVRVEGGNGKPDPFLLSAAADIGIPSVVDPKRISFILKTGVSMTFSELIILSFSWPGASGLNARELANGAKFPGLPSIGLGVNFALKSGGERIAGGRLPSDGDITVHAAARPLYEGAAAIGAGITWKAGVLDKTPPAIAVDYPEILYISPDNNGKADNLLLPVSISDQRYIAEWIMEISDEDGRIVRTYRNKERRPETQGVRNFFSRLADVKSGVEVPPVLSWDGIFDSGDRAPDGTYTFNITAWDDNNNMASSPAYRVVVDNTPPEAAPGNLSDADRIFSPDGDGNKDTLVIPQSGSFEDVWEGGIYDSTGNRVRSFRMEGSLSDIVWDGKDDEGRIVPDGVYRYLVSSTDRALNTTEKGIDNIMVSTIQPAVGLSISDAWFSPNGDGIKDTVSLTPGVSVREGVTGWNIRIRDAQGTVRRTLQSGSAVPEKIDFDGLAGGGTALAEGSYQAYLTVTYRNGYVSTALSPVFNLDITPPRAVVRAAYPAFSPNNDGNQDEMIIYQEASEETLWTGDFRRLRGESGERPVRSFRFPGAPPAQLRWDGHGDSGTFAADGGYTYELYAVDPAGNTGRSNTASFTLSTADTPVMITTDLRAFSPNGDRVKDTISINPVIQVREGVEAWKIDILNGGRTVQTFEGGGLPAPVLWNGRDSSGVPAPEGSYTAEIEVRYVQGNRPRAVSLPFDLDITPPRTELSAPYTVFSPNGDGRRDFIPFPVNTDGDEEWEATITNAQGQTVRTWRWRGKAPALAWEGTDEAGNNAPDGTYRFNLASTDEAGNSVKLTVPDISLDARVPRVFLTSSAQDIAPKGSGEIRFGIITSLGEGIENWTLELRDGDGNSARTFTGEKTAPPGTISWNGLAENGRVREGKFTPVLTVNYIKGDIAAAQTPPVTVDVTGPVLSFASRPEYFSPDNDGVDDELIMNLGAEDISPIASWSFEIHEPQPPYQLFWRIEGRESPAAETVWNGKSNRGELVQSATDYPFTYRAEDTLGNASSMEGAIGVDVLVIRDGNNLKIQVPSIVFRANAADFEGLDPAVVDNNIRILRRIAEILNKFRDYRVQVEGHANPVVRTEAEERTELQPLSESRARAVVNMLGEYGVARTRLSSTGMGGSRPVIRWEDRDNWWKNRRVEFILIK